MTENHGAHGDAGATDNEDLNTQETAATNESAAAKCMCWWQGAAALRLPKRPVPLLAWLKCWWPMRLLLLTHWLKT